MQEIKQCHIDEFEATVAKLDNLMKKINKYAPEATIYVDEDSFCLLPCNSHDENGNPNNAHTIAVASVRSFGCGGW